MEEGEEIGLVLARALELRSKISECIDRGDGSGGGEAEEEEEEEAEAESLLAIRDALESLERQIAALQALQQQQRYEREAILAQIDHSRMILLSKLKEYKGEDSEVIHEATAFAGEAIEHDDGLILPPYPSHLPDLFVLDALYPTSQFAAKYRRPANGLEAEPAANKRIDESEKNQSSHHVNRNPPKGIRRIIGLVAKSVVTFVSVVSILSIAGYKPKLLKGATPFKALELFSKPATGERPASIPCPPGKFLVIEDGKARCLVKERVEIPFELEVRAPNISYGFG